MRKRLAAEVLTSRTKPGGRGPYKKDRGRIFPRHNQTDGVNKGFIIWYFWTAREKRDKGWASRCFEQNTVKQTSNNTQ